MQILRISICGDVSNKSYVVMSVMKFNIQATHGRQIFVTETHLLSKLNAIMLHVVHHFIHFIHIPHNNHKYIYCYS